MDQGPFANSKDVMGLQQNDREQPRSIETTGSDNISFNVGNNSTVNVNLQSRPDNHDQDMPQVDATDASNSNGLKRTHPSDESGPSRKQWKHGHDGHGEPMAVDAADHPRHNCLLETKGKRGSAESHTKKRKGKTMKISKSLKNIPNMDYNGMKIEIDEEMSEQELRKCCKLLKQDSSGSGINEKALKDIEEPEQLLDLMEKTNLLSKDNLCFLQMLLHKIKNEQLLDVVDEYVQKHQDDPISLFFTKTKRPNGTCLVEFRVEGKAKHTKTRRIHAFKKKLAQNLGIKMHQIILTGIGVGSVIMVFQIPEQVVGKLHAAVMAKADWLIEEEVLGVHIDGEPYQQVMEEKPQGTIFGASLSSFNLEEFFSSLICVGSCDQSLLAPIFFRDVPMVFHGRSTCTNCKTQLQDEDPVICVKDNLYHKACFTCYKCCQPIAEGNKFFVRRDGKLLCLPDLQDVMRKDIQQLQIFSSSDAMIQPARDTMEHGCQTETLLNHVDKLTTQTMAEDMEEQTPSESSFDLLQFQNELRQHYLQNRSQIPLKVDNHTTTYIDMDDIFVDLSLFYSTQEPSEIQKLPLQSYQQLFNQIGTGSSVIRLVLDGLNGCGKTTLISKIAYDWAKVVEGSLLNEIDLLFVLDVDKMDCSKSIEDAILSHLFPNGTNTGPDQLSEYLSKNSSRVMLILDGCSCLQTYTPEGACDQSCQRKSSYCEILQDCDSMVSDPKETCLLKFSACKLLQSCHIMVTKSLFNKFDPSFKYVEVCGFSTDNVSKYVQKFFSWVQEDIGLGEKLLSYIGSDLLIQSVVTIPVVLVELCLMWRKTNGSEGVRMTKLIKSVLNRIGSQIGSTRDGQPNVDALVKQIGKLALDTPRNVKNTTMKEGDKALSSSLQDACQMGLMVSTEQMDRKEMDQMYSLGEYSMIDETYLGFLQPEPSMPHVRRVVQFVHKTFQEYCAAVYLVSLHEEFKDKTQFFNYLEAYNDVHKAFMIQSVLMFACGLNQHVAKKILRGLLEIFASQLEHSIGEYYKDELSFDESSTMQEFILMCLGCNYEADVADKFSTLLKKLVPSGELKFVGITDSDAMAIAYYLRHKGQHTIHSIKLKTIPRSCQDLEPDELCMTYPDQHLERSYSKESLMAEASRLLERLKCSKSLSQPELQVVAAKTPLKVMSHVQRVQRFIYVPSSTPHTLEPIYIVIGTMELNVELNILDVRGFPFNGKTAELVKSITSGLLPNLSTLKLENTGLTKQHMEKLATHLSLIPNLQELDLSNNDADHCLSFLGETLSGCPFLKAVSLRHMQTQPSDMVLFLEKFPQFGSKVHKFHISGNEMNDDVAHAFLTYVAKSCVLNDLDISVGGMSREIHQTLIRGIQGLSSLQKLSLSHSGFPGDLLSCAGDILSSVDKISRLSVGIDVQLFPGIDHSMWIDFKGKLKQATNLKKLYLLNVELEQGDFKELLQLCQQCNLDQLRYYTGCLPDGYVIDGDYEFLTLL